MVFKGTSAEVNRQGCYFWIHEQTFLCGIGRCRVYLKRTKETFTISPISSKIHHPMVAAYVDHVGDLLVVNAKTGDRAQIRFEECKRFGRDKGKVNGTIEVCTKDGTFKEVGHLKGMWNQSVEYQPNEPNQNTESAVVPLWTLTPTTKNDIWQRSHFAILCSSCQSKIRLQLPFRAWS